MTYQEKQESGIVCFDVTKNNQHIGLGLENQKVVLKTRSGKEEDTEDEEKDI